MNGRELAALAGQENVVVIRRPFVEWLGHVADALLIDQALYWQSEAGAGAWWHKTDEAMAKHLCLSLHALSQARGRLTEAGYLKAVRRGVPARMHYLADMDAIGQGFAEHVEQIQPTSNANPQNLRGESAEHSFKKVVKVVKGSSAPPRKAQPATIPALKRRDPKPLFDAFRGTFPTSAAALAGQFDSAATAAGLTAADWEAFVSTAKAAQDLADGYLTPRTAMTRFQAWAKGKGKSAGSRRTNAEWEAIHLAPSRKGYR